MAMVKVIRVPLTDINNRDFKTGAYVKPRKVKQEENLFAKAAKRREKKIEEAKKMGRTDGKIHVDGFGWVS